MKLIRIIAVVFFFWMVFLLSCVKEVYASPEILINVPEYKLRVMDEGQLIKTYGIAVGDPSSKNRSLIGNYEIYFKEVNPIWYPTEYEKEAMNVKEPVQPGPSNPLGTRWMEFAPAYGIHGTIYDWSIGHAVSGGCFRMVNSDVEELFEYIPLKTKVKIIYETILIFERPDGLYVRFLSDIYNRKTNTLEHYQEVIKPYLAKYPSASSISETQIYDNNEVKVVAN